MTKKEKIADEKWIEKRKREILENILSNGDNHKEDGMTKKEKIAFGILDTTELDLTQEEKIEFEKQVEIRKQEIMIELYHLLGITPDFIKGKNEK